jgi:NAD(P)-dependent dehydrogenase (short-subunit alcohol dehydrogenase family)
MVEIAPDFEAEEAAAALYRELHDPAAAIREVGISRNSRVTVGLRHSLSADSTTALTPSDVLVVTGGARGVTAACIAELARKIPCGFILLGRTAPADSPEWAVPGAGEAQLKQAIMGWRKSRALSVAPREIESDYRQYRAQEEIRATLAALRAAGAEAHYVVADIADATSLRNALSPWLARITGVIHGAGVLADKRIVDKTWADVTRVFEPKLAGLRHILSVLETGRLRHVALFSSVAALFGNRGQSAYAIANEALNKIALLLKHRYPGLHVTSIDWGAWDGGMVSPQLKKIFEERGIALIPRETGARMFAAQFLPGSTDAVVTMIGPNTPLSPIEPPETKTTVTSARSMSAFNKDPLIRDHTIGRNPVLPATYALGWMTHSAERIAPHLIATGVADFQVLKGIVFDGAEPDEVFCDARPSDCSIDVALSAPTPSGVARKFYRTAVTVAPAPASAAAIAGFDGKLTRLHQVNPYENGTLFHGPALQGIHRASDVANGEMLLECRLDSNAGPAHLGCASRLYNPALADLLLQSALVLAREVKHTAGLPLRIAGAEFFRPLAYGETFWVLLDEIFADEGQVVCRARACDRSGRVYMTFSGISVLLSAELESKFAARTPVPAGALV